MFVAGNWHENLPRNYALISITRLSIDLFFGYYITTMIYCQENVLKLLLITEDYTGKIRAIFDSMTFYRLLGKEAFQYEIIEKTYNLIN